VKAFLGKAEPELEAVAVAWGAGIRQAEMKDFLGSVGA
jgi:hypothetical protein